MKHITAIPIFAAAASASAISAGGVIFRKRGTVLENVMLYLSERRLGGARGGRRR